MLSDLPRRGLFPVLAAIAALSSPALAGPAEDCRNRDLDDAVRMRPCTTAIDAASDPADRADLLLWRGAIHKRAQDFEQAEADFTAAQALRPDWADPHVERAYLLKEQGNLEGALAAIRQGWEAEPGSLYAASELMSFLADAGRWQDCLDVAPRALELGPEDPWTYAHRGRCLADGGQHEAAVADDRRAIALGLEESFVHSNLAWSLLELGRPEEAAVEVQAAVALDPENMLAQGHLLRALVLSDDPQGAIAAYRAAAPASAKDRKDLANDLAWALYRQGRTAEALPIAEQAMEAMRDSGSPSPDVLDTYGHLLAAAGRAEDAAKAFLEAVEADSPRGAAYAERLGDLGFPADPASLEAALLACAKTGAACRLAD